MTSEHDDLPIVAEARPVERPQPPIQPVVVQTAAAAAGGLLAGVGATAIVRLLRGRRRRRVSRRWRRRRNALPVVASRSFLVDVHVLDPRR